MAWSSGIGVRKPSMPVHAIWLNELGLPLAAQIGVEKAGADRNEVLVRDDTYEMVIRDNRNSRNAVFHRQVRRITGGRL